MPNPRLQRRRRRARPRWTPDGPSDTFLLGEDPPSYRGGAARLKASETAVRVLRMRTRFRERLRETVANTVANPAEVEAELKWVASTLLSP